MIKWELARHQVAIAGCVTDAQTGKPIAGAQVSIDSTQIAMVTGPDGHFHFLDLADGQYTLAASLLGGGSRYGTAQVMVAVAHDAQGNLKLAAVDIALPSTSIEGQITGPSNALILMAQVRIKGSGEQTYSDAQGKYVLTALETGNRTILVTAQSYQPASRTVQIAQPGCVQTLNLSLIPNP